MNAQDSLKIGTTFTKRSERAYTLADGTKGLHVRVDEWRVTATDEIGLVAEYEGTVEESGRPPFATYPLETSLAWFGAEASIARGDLKIVQVD